jgi:hypothetical protein
MSGDLYGVFTCEGVRSGKEGDESFVELPLSADYIAQMSDPRLERPPMQVSGNDLERTRSAESDQSDRAPPRRSCKSDDGIVDADSASSRR